MSQDRRSLLPTSRHASLVGIAAVLVAGSLVVAFTRPAGPGAGGLPRGTQAPPFAVVLATSDVVCDSDDDPCDANVAASGAGDQGAAGSRPALHPSASSAGFPAPDPCLTALGTRPRATGTQAGHRRPSDPAGQPAKPRTTSGRMS